MFSTLKGCSRFLGRCSALRTYTVREYAKLIQLKNTRSPSMSNLCHYKNSSRMFSNVTKEEIILPADTTNVDIDAIAKGDSDLEHKLKMLILEVEVMRQEGRRVPDNVYMKQKQWEMLMSLPTVSARRRYLEFEFKISKSRENQQMKKEAKRVEREKVLAERESTENETFEDFVSKYDLSHNNLFLRFYDTTINHFYNSRLIKAIQFGQKLVVDCGYHQSMTSRENGNCAKQLMLLFADNRMHDDPFDLYYCNSDKESSLMHSLYNYINTLYDPSFPLHVHESSYLDLFPKEKLVYLTPHCREEMVEFDHDAIYIIGGIVDKVNQEPLSLAKAKAEGLKMAKFPLDRYLQWGSGSGKSLTVNQVANILLDIKLTGDWNHALRHVPRRKLIQSDQVQEQHSTSTAINSAERRRERKPWAPKFNTGFETNFKDQRSFLEVKNSKKRPLRTIKSILYDSDEERS